MTEELRSRKRAAFVRSWARDHRTSGSGGLSPWSQAVATSKADGVLGVALMPDAHVGKGACVGSVVATEDTILPAAVGVDLGCFPGDTQVALCDGPPTALRELAERGSPVLVWAVDRDRRVVRASAAASLTRAAAPLSEVVLSEGTAIACTPDHEFMLSDGSYRQACDLSPGDALMSLDRHSDRDQVAGPRSGARGAIPAGRSVREVRETGRREDVYCLTVPEHRNFALAAGVFVHNCGMTAAPVSLTASQLPDDLSGVLAGFGQMVPTITHAGRKSQNRAPRRQASAWMRSNPIPSGGGDAARALDQLGTLGRGNHFLEVSVDETGAVWLVLHSGSRGIGNTLAGGHIAVARQLDRAGDRGDLAAFAAGTPEFDAYVADMNWAQQYAFVNRETALMLALDAFSAALGTQVTVRQSDIVRCHHNYAVKEQHMGRSVWVTRKGAIRARAGDLGIIPGSMGTSTYIVEGLGNPDSFESAAHGAGRVMSRAAARRNVSVRALVKAMEGRTWLDQSAKSLLDEAPQAYKDIDQVMAAQSDLCRPVRRLSALVSYKGV